MAPLTPGQLRTRQRIEGLIKLAAPALDLVLAVGERVSKVVEREDVEYYPPRVTRESPPPPSARDARRPAPVGGPLGRPRGGRVVRRRRVLLVISATAVLPEGPQGHRARSPTSCSSIDDAVRRRTSRRRSSRRSSALLLLGVFYYLFRAIGRARRRRAALVHRTSCTPAPLLFAIGASVLARSRPLDIADKFASGTPIRGQAGRGPREGSAATRARSSSRPRRPARVGMAFLFVMLPLRARRVGLLTPFMGILGVDRGRADRAAARRACSAIVQAFWLGALGALFLGRWPGGRGPAWETRRGRAVAAARAAPRRSPRRGRAEPAADEPRPGHARRRRPEPVPDVPRRASGARGARRSPGASGRRLERRLHVRLRELRVLELPGQVGLVGGHVEVAVAGQAEQDHALLARLLGRLGLVDHRADRVGRLRPGDDPLGAREAQRRGERLVLPVGARLDSPFLTSPHSIGESPW